MNKKNHYIHDFYNHYDSLDLSNKVEYSLFKSIIERFGTLLSEALLDYSKELILPYYLGSMQILKYKPKSYVPGSGSVSVDFHLTKLYGKTIWHLNEHSDGYKYRLLWSKINGRFINKDKYMFIMSRANKRKLAQIIKNKQTDYPEL